MRLSLKIAKILARLINTETVPNSAAKSPLIEDLIAENILYRKGKHRKTLELIDKKALEVYLTNQLQINDLYDYISLLESQTATRADFVKIATDSKKSKIRTFKGFLVNSYNIISTQLNDKIFEISPTQGSFTFIYDYETFKIPKEITVVGVENASNFRHIQEQKYLFENINPLFISRYPQYQHKDVIKWLQSIPNQYLHFGDFDMAGIGIYLNEYKKYLADKASFFVPKNIEEAIEPEILDLIRIINKEKKGLDQEYYI